jgi:hypothetical protein
MSDDGGGGRDEDFRRGGGGDDDTRGGRETGGDRGGDRGGGDRGGGDRGGGGDRDRGGGGGRHHSRDDGVSLLVRGLPTDASADEIKSCFEKYGEVADVYLPKVGGCTSKLLKSS